MVMVSSHLDQRQTIRHEGKTKLCRQASELFEFLEGGRGTQIKFACGPMDVSNMTRPDNRCRMGVEEKIEQNTSAANP